MAPRKRSSHTPRKPTVFLSHSSANRRELIRLKRFLDERAGGMIEFFLSSDEESIVHGTIWPSEVRAALDRMALMLVFVSKDALKSGWTYFEAGYGLKTLGAANIYCLPGTEKAALPPPFDLIQNRNLHSARDLNLLIQQCNSVLGGHLNEHVTSNDFDGVFKRPGFAEVTAIMKLSEIVDSIYGDADGPPNSIEIFEEACRLQNHAFSETTALDEWTTRPAYDIRCAAGVEFKVPIPLLDEERPELEITETVREAGGASWRRLVYGDGFLATVGPGKNDWMTLKAIEEKNAKIRESNTAIREARERALTRSRTCSFEVATIGASTAISLVDKWISLANASVDNLKLLWASSVKVEERPATIAAKINGSQLELQRDGTFLWLGTTVLKLTADRGLQLSNFPATQTPITDVGIEDIVATLIGLEIISVARSNTKRR